MRLFPGIARSAFCACLALGVCLWAETPPNPSPARTAGQVQGLVPMAFRNANPAQLKEPVVWNDLLRTEEKGRLRVTLTDGSLLSLGSKAQLCVLVHNPQSQETALELTYGELRSRVKRLTQPQSVFMIKTPQAVLGALGTDFYVLARPNVTEVLCFSGAVYITARDGRPLMILPEGRMTRIEHERPEPHREIPEDRGRRGRQRTRLDEHEVENDQVLHAELAKGLDSKKARPGDEVTARTTRKARVDEKTELPENTELIGRVVESQARGNRDPASRLAVVFEKAVLRGGEQISLVATVQAVRAPHASVTVRGAFGPRSEVSAHNRGTRFGGVGGGGSGGGGGGSSGSSGSGSSGSGGDDSGGSGSSGSGSGSGSSGSGGGGSNDLLSSGSGSSGSDDGSDDHGGSSGSGGSGSSKYDNFLKATEDHLGDYSAGTYGMRDTVLQRASVEGGVAIVSSGESVRLEGGSELILRLPE